MTRRSAENPLTLAKRAMTEAALAMLSGDPQRVEKAQRALAMLREAEQPPAPARDGGRTFRVGSRARLRVIR